MKAIYLFTGSDGHSHFKTGSIINQSLVKTISTQFKETLLFQLMIGIMLQFYNML